MVYEDGLELLDTRCPNSMLVGREDLCSWSAMRCTSVLDVTPAEN